MSQGAPGEMKIAVNTICVREHAWRDALSEVADAGFESVELLAIEGWVHVQPGDVPASDVLAEAERHGLRICGLHAGGFGGSSEGELSRSVAYLRRAAALAAELGAEYMVFTGFPTPEGTGPSERAAIRTRLARGLEDLLPVTSGHGIPIALENHYSCQVETLEDMQAILDEVGAGVSDLGATVDTGHFTSSGIDPAAAVRALRERVIHVHVKDHVGHASVGLGSGETDNAAVVRELRELGYGGYLTVELEMPYGEDAMRHLREARPYVESLIARA